VVKNVHTKGLWQELQPLMIRYLKAEHHSQLLVSTEHTKVASVDSYLASKWKELLPNRLYSGKRISDEYEDVDEVNSNIILMNLFEGITVLLLSCFGLYTLVSLNIMKRMKEIGVRKTLGATIFNISLIINMEFFIVLGIAFIIGGIISYHLSNLLMSSVWKYYLPVTITSIIASFFFLLVITGFTFFIKVIHLKKINPVDTLRNN
jgi:putative ABC transport system permease protein